MLKLSALRRPTNCYALQKPKRSDDALSFEGTIATWSDLAFLALSDAGWATLLDWRSWRLTRVARSCLNAET